MSVTNDLLRKVINKKMCFDSEKYRLLFASKNSMCIGWLSFEYFQQN